MTKKEAKALITEHGLYEATRSLMYIDYANAYNLFEIIERVYDAIPTAVLEKAIKKATR